MADLHITSEGAVNPRRDRTDSRRQQHVDENDLRTGRLALNAISLETSLYILILLLAALLRLFLLDSRPLSVDEGMRALESYRIWTGDTPASLQQGPLTAFGTLLAIAMLSGSDGAARLLSALAGTALVVTPYFFRESLGRAAAIIAAFGLALSPLVVFASRTVSSGVIPLLAAAGLLWLLVGRTRLGVQARAYGAAITASALLTSGPDGITVAVGLLLAAALSSAGTVGRVSAIRAALKSAAFHRAATLFLAFTLLIGTGLGTRLIGLQWATADSASEWISSFSLGASRGGFILLLALYEIPVVILGTVQLLRSVARRDSVDAFLSLWAMSMLLMGMLQDGPVGSRLLLPMVPLYLLAARLASESMGALSKAGSGWRWNTALLAVSLPIAVGMGLLTRGTTPGLELPTPILYGELALAAAALLTYWVLLSGGERLALAWVVFGALSVGFLVHTTVFLNFKSATIWAEPVAGAQPTAYLRDAAIGASYYSRYYGTRLTVDPELRAAAAWYLRDATEVAWDSKQSPGINLLLWKGVADAVPDGDRRPGTVLPVVDAARLRWQAIWRWMLDRNGDLVATNQRDIIVRMPFGSW